MASSEQRSNVFFMMLQKNAHPNVACSHPRLQPGAFALEEALREKSELLTAIVDTTLNLTAISYEISESADFFQQECRFSEATLCHRIHEQLSFKNSSQFFQPYDCYIVIYKIAHTFNSHQTNHPEHLCYQEKKKQQQNW